MIGAKDQVNAGFTLARTPRKTVRTKDITGGLPRVAELVEARTPKEAAEIAKIEGIVELGGIAKGKRKLIVRDSVTGAEEEHLIAFFETEQNIRDIGGRNLVYHLSEACPFSTLYQVFDVRDI